MSAGASANPTLRILHLEDDPGDSELAEAILATEGLACNVTRIDTREAFEAALRRGGWDLILSDFSLPSFDGLQALALARKLAPQVPFIILSGTIGEERAVESLNGGATDYLLKQRPKRLGAAVSRALEQARERARLELAEKALQRNEQYFRTLIENALDIITVLDAQGNFTFNSLSAQRLLGYDLDWLQGKNAFDFVHPEDLAAVLAAFEFSVAHPGQTVSLEFRFRRRDGSWCYLEAVGKSLLHQLDFGGVVVNSRDITERKLAEEQIREQAAWLDKAQDAICVTDLDQRIRYWNQSAERLYGWSAPEAMGRNVNDLLFGADLSVPIQALKHLISRGEWLGELRQISKDKTDVVVESRWTLVRDRAGNPRSILVINTDVTETKKLEAQFFRAQRMESIGVLAGGIAHDLNNVLAPVLMSVQLLQEKVTDEEGRQILRMLHASAKRGADLVRQILSFARGLGGERVTLHPGHLLAEMECIARDTFPRNIKLRRAVAADLRSVDGDPTQLQQVLMNLCVNARDAMPAGGELSLSAENVEWDVAAAARRPQGRPGPYVKLSIRDTGAGIPPAVLDKIFDPFFTTKEIGKGTGLGLSTVQGIVRSHGGFIEVQTGLGQGTCFDLYFPAAAGAAPALTSVESSEPPGGRGELLLLVDDELALLHITQQTLESYGYRVLAAQDGREALALFEQHGREIAAVITDMIMPNLDGLATVQALRRMQPDVRIIGVSGSMDSAKIKELTVTEKIRFLVKPYPSEVLLQTVRELLDQPPA